MASTGKQPKPPIKADSARGRTVAAKPLDGSTASSRAKQNYPGGSVGKGLSIEKKAPRRTSPGTSVTSITSLKPSERAATSGKPPAKSQILGVKESNPLAAKTTSKPDSVSLSESRPLSSAPATGNAKASAPPSVTATPVIEEPPTCTSDPLQVAAQVYPWLYMTSTLETCFQTAEEKAKKDLAERSRQLEEDEYDIADQRIRFEAERAADFYDELATDYFSKEAPLIMQTFLTHGDVCTRVEAEALRLATHGASELDEDNPLQIYNDMFDNLEDLHAEAVKLESSILRLTSPSSLSIDNPSSSAESSPSDPPPENAARSQILGVFVACLPVIRARISNLAMAQELIDGAQENLSISLRMESLGLLD